MTKHTFFISDLHISDDDPTTLHALLRFLEQCNTETDAVYILGDLFDAYIGDDNQTASSQAVIKGLAQLKEKNISVFLLHGNRDFLIGELFLQQSGCTLLPEEACITVYNQRILLMHGDTLCTKDTSYQRLRKILRNKWYQACYLSLPLSLRQYLASFLRNKSKQYTQKKEEEIMDVTHDMVINRMLAHDVDVLIHGHTHKPKEHHFSHHTTSKKRIVLGAWHDHASILRLNDDGSFELIVI